MSKPNLSKIANNDWQTEFDIDSIIADETKASTSVSTTTNTTPVVEEKVNTTPVIDPYREAMFDVLDKTIKQDFTPTKNTNEQFKDSGTRDLSTQTPQQNLNQLSTQQQNNDSNVENENDPYILAFNLLQDFDFIRLPENVDITKLDVQTLQMYKEETLYEQHQEALEGIRQQMANDPLMLQLFNYAYHGKNFADLPRMQAIQQKAFDFSSYDLKPIANQRNIVKLYYSDGLNQADDRDKKILALIPTQIKQLEDDLKLKEEAVKAQNFFIERARAEAAQEEDRVIALLQEQDRLEQQKEADQRAWNKAFTDTLAKRTWSEGKKASIVNETNYVKLKDGSSMPLWQYKQMLMLEDPNLFQTFLDFTSRFNIEKNSFTESNEEALNQNTLSQFVNRLQSKTSNPKHTTISNNNPHDPNAPKKPRVVDMDKWSDF